MWKLVAEENMWPQFYKFAFAYFGVRIFILEHGVCVSFIDGVRCRVCNFVFVPSAIRTLVSSFLPGACQLIYRHVDNILSLY